MAGYLNEPSLQERFNAPDASRLNLKVRLALRQEFNKSHDNTIRDGLELEVLKIDEQIDD